MTVLSKEVSPYNSNDGGGRWWWAVATSNSVSMNCFTIGWKLTKQSSNNPPLLERTKCVLGDRSAKEQDDRSAQQGGSDDNNNNNNNNNNKQWWWLGCGNDRYQ
jgi:hypothetical protein